MKKFLIIMMYLIFRSFQSELYKVRMQKYINMQSSGKYMNMLVGMGDLMQNAVVSMAGANTASSSSAGFGSGTFSDWSPMSRLAIFLVWISGLNDFL